ncbi:FAD-dependent oxidoreductase [Hymenobacter saemangeumensis]
MANQLFPVPALAPSIIVVGAGLAGLTAAQALHQAGLPVPLLEARDRVGGRTLAVPAVPGSPEEAWLDLGAARDGTHHPFLMQLFRKLDCRPFEQPSTGAMAYEMAEGIHRLPNRLARPGACREIFRVLKPGGELFTADVFADRRRTAPASRHRRGCVTQHAGYGRHSSLGPLP